MSKSKTLQEELDELHLAWGMFYKSTWLYKLCTYLLDRIKHI